MIPFRDNAAPRRLTPVNVSLIAINLAIFIYEVSLGAGLGAFIDRFAMVPAAVATVFGSSGHVSATLDQSARLAPLATILTAMFLHGGLWHVAGNMLYLYIFGAAVEWRMGSRRYLCFYLLAGIAAALVTVMISPASQVPVIGASGAIAGVLGAYFVFFPRGRISTVLPIFIFIQIIEIPAVIYLLLWFAAQLYSGLSEGGAGAVTGGVAWWAHVGGFMFGVALAPLIADERVQKKIARR